MNPFPTISLCMIAKDEAELIAQCINSVRSILLETIVVDTGSTDQTREIVTGLGATLIESPWNDDFSTPRNLGIAAARGDWILVLDADEVIAPRDLPVLYNHTLSMGVLYEMTQRHYTCDARLSGFRPVAGEYPEFEKGERGFFESSLVRLFPRVPEIRYTGRIHELVEHSVAGSKDYKIVRSPVPIHHYGHTTRVRSRKNKGRLYTDLGQTKAKETPKDWKALFELGIEHNANGRLADSAEALYQSTQLNPLYVQTWVNLGYVLCELTRYKEAILALAQALKLDPRCEEAFCNLGVVYLRTRELEKAEQQFRAAITLKADYINAYCNLGATLCAQQRYAEGAQIYRRALELMPSCLQAKLALGNIYFSCQLLNEAERFISQVVSESADDVGAQVFLNEIRQKKLLAHTRR